MNIEFVGGPAFLVPGDVVRVRLGLGAGTITGGTANLLTISRLRYELDCLAPPTGIGCTDEGDIFRYVGDHTIAVQGCGGAGWTSDGVDDAATKQVIFTPSAPVVIPANTSATSDFCRVEFDVRLENAPGNDATPNVVQVAAGYGTVPPEDAICDQASPIPGLAGGTGQIRLCMICDDGDACTTESCNQTSGQCETTHTVTCPDPTCEVCHPATGICEDRAPLPAICTPLGCSIAAGGIARNGATFGGQVGAPCGCIDCFGNIEGQWQHNRHNRKGRIHTSLYRSLICQLDESGGPEPRPAPSNRACWTGLGRIAMSSARNDPRTEPVIVRVDVEDRGEPGGGQNAGDPDLYRIRAWDPTGLSDQEVEELFAGICCKTYFEPDSIQPPAGSVLLVDDGGEPGIVHGNIQIHPVLPNTERGICPPRQSCFE